MHQKKSKKIFFYFFLLFLLGSINNFKLNDLKLNSIKKINVSGLDDENNNTLLNDIEKINLKNIFIIDRNILINIIETNPLIENYNVFKKYPDSIDIFIEQTEFLAKINKNGKTFLVGKNGKLTKNNLSTSQLPFIFGNPQIKDVVIIKKIIDQSKFSYNQVENLYYFPSNRWDIELKNKIIIKLSKQNIKQTLDNVYDLFINEEFGNVKMYDARIKNQIILND